MMTRIISTACCRLTALASSRGAVPNTSPATAGRPRSGCLTQSTKAATPAWATSPSQDRFSADIRRNHGSRRSMDAIAAVPSELIDPSRRRMVSWLACLFAGSPDGCVPFAVADSGSAITLPACHAGGPAARRSTPAGAVGESGGGLVLVLEPERGPQARHDLAGVARLGAAALGERRA